MYILFLKVHDHQYLQCTRIITLTVRLYLYSNVLFHTKKPNMYLEIDHISSICSVYQTDI